jgi:HAD superfamily hydrolase (TIGR01484 family)
MTNYKHLFFDMDMTIAPSRQPILPEMFKLLSETTQDIIIVSGSTIEQIAYQSNNLPAIKLGQNGNHAVARDGSELWHIPLETHHRDQILDHISEIVELLEHELNHDWNPIEDRGAQITFSPIGNTAPVELKKHYDPDRKKRESLLAQIPFASEDLLVKIGGSTSLDYIHKDRQKGNNIIKLLDLMGWDKKDCIYYGDGLYPGGNDESVIGVIETVFVENHIDTYEKLKRLLL